MKFRHISYLLIGFSIIALTGCHSSRKNDEAPVLTSINIIDRNGLSETTSNKDRLKLFENVDFLCNQPYQKVMRIYSRDCNGDIHAYITSYHPNGHPRQYLEVVNNRAFGYYREWHPNGTLKLETRIIGGEADINTSAEQSWLFDGESQTWDEDGHLIATIPYANGELEGISFYYHPNGKIWKRIPFSHGKMEGISETYLECGNVLQTTEFCAGEKNGISRRHWENGQISSDEIYSHGKLVTGRYYSLSSELVAVIDNGKGYRVLFGKTYITEMHEYNEGYVDGEIKIFDENGSLVRLYHVKNGLKHGVEIDYYDMNNGKNVLVPRISINWIEGRIQGITKTWYPNGVQESQREMNNNDKNGLLTAWYRDGSLMLIEEYEKDRLVKGEYYIRGEKIPISNVKNGKGTATLFDPDGNMVRKVPYHNGKPSL